VRTAPDGGYDFFLYKGMKVRLTGQVEGQWRVRLSALQSGWVKESALQELPRGTVGGSSFLNNFTVTHLSDETLIRIPLSEMLAWRAEESMNPMRLTLTLYGAMDRTNLIRYDATDPLVHLIQWKQIGSDTAQIIIDPTFKRWWGYDVHYEGATLVIGLRAPWKKDIHGMVIAIDPGHGGSDTGAVGALGTLEKDTNLAIARVVKDTLEKAGAKPFLTRDRDMDVPLIDRGRIAWRAGARLFISIHGNASGVEENPLWNNGFSVYFYHPQSMGLARAVHDNYRRQLSLPDHGLYYDDLSVCRTFQMPAILTEQAYLIVPAQEQMLLDPKFHRALGASILNGIKEWLAE
jgi:N-acetylmuramoyl-L-alanine amidase